MFESSTGPLPATSFDDVPGALPDQVVRAACSVTVWVGEVVEALRGVPDDAAPHEILAAMQELHDLLAPFAGGTPSGVGWDPLTEATGLLDTLQEIHPANSDTSDDGDAEFVREPWVAGYDEILKTLQELADTIQAYAPPDPWGSEPKPQPGQHPGRQRESGQYGEPDPVPGAATGQADADSRELAPGTRQLVEGVDAVVGALGRARDGLAAHREVFDLENVWHRLGTGADELRARRAGVLEHGEPADALGRALDGACATLTEAHARCESILSDQARQLSDLRSRWEQWEARWAQLPREARAVARADEAQRLRRGLARLPASLRDLAAVGEAADVAVSAWLGAGRGPDPLPSLAAAEAAYWEMDAVVASVPVAGGVSPAEGPRSQR